MKPLLSLLILLLVSITTKGQIQLDDFYKQGTTWCEVYREIIIKQPPRYHYYHFTIGQDSVITQNNYHLLYYSDREGVNSKIFAGLRVSSDSVFLLKLDTFSQQPSIT